jgi:AcrR family transcriptional regulator
LLLTAAEELLREEGHGGITSRRIGAKAGVHYQLVHYYFGSMENLFLELWRRFAQHYVARVSRAFLAPRPLRTIWEFNIDRYDTALGAELMLVARQHAALREEIATTVERLRQMQASALAPIMDDCGLRERFGSPEILMVFIAGMARILVVEDELGIAAGNPGARALIEKWIDNVELGAGNGEPAGSE